MLYQSSSRNIFFVLGILELFVSSLLPFTRKVEQCAAPQIRPRWRVVVGWWFVFHRFNRKRAESVGLGVLRRSPEMKIHPLNVDGPFYVDSECCLSCSLPRETAPKLFAYDKDMVCYVVKQPKGEEELNQMLEVLQHQDIGCIRCRSQDQSLRARVRALGNSDILDGLKDTPQTQDPYASPKSDTQVADTAATRRKKAKTRSRILFVVSYVVALLLLEHHFFLGVGPEKAPDSPSVFASIAVLLIFWVLGRIVIGLFRR